MELIENIIGPTTRTKQKIVNITQLTTRKSDISQHGLRI